MRLGIVIVFNSVESSILKEQLIRSISSLNNVCFCLINNKNNDKTYNYLNEISDKCKNTNVVNIKKSKSTNSAIRAGARFMFNQYNLNHLGYINQPTNFQVIEVIENFKTNQEKIIGLVVNEQSSKTVRQTLFQKIFSVAYYVEKLNCKSFLYS